MSDRELLEIAAKAAGLKIFGFYGKDGQTTGADIGPDDVVRWNPLTDDGDALRLAVKLGLSVHAKLRDEEGYASASVWGVCQIRENALGGDLCVATRRAITRAAAEIGRAML